MIVVHARVEVVQIWKHLANENSGPHSSSSRSGSRSSGGDRSGLPGPQGARLRANSCPDVDGVVASESTASTVLRIEECTTLSNIKKGACAFVAHLHGSAPFSVPKTMARVIVEVRSGSPPRWERLGDVPGEERWIALRNAFRAAENEVLASYGGSHSAIGVPTDCSMIRVTLPMAVGKQRDWAAQEALARLKSKRKRSEYLPSDDDRGSSVDGADEDSDDDDDGGSGGSGGGRRQHCDVQEALPQGLAKYESPDGAYHIFYRKITASMLAARARALTVLSNKAILSECGAFWQCICPADVHGNPITVNTPNVAISQCMVAKRARRRTPQKRKKKKKKKKNTGDGAGADGAVRDGAPQQPEHDVSEPGLVAGDDDVVMQPAEPALAVAVAADELVAAADNGDIVMQHAQPDLVDELSAAAAGQLRAPPPAEAGAHQLATHSISEHWEEGVTRSSWRVVPIDKTTGSVRLDDMRRHISKHTTTSSEREMMFRKGIKTEADREVERVLYGNLRRAFRNSGQRSIEDFVRAPRASANGSALTLPNEGMDSDVEVDEDTASDLAYVDEIAHHLRLLVISGVEVRRMVPLQLLRHALSGYLRAAGLPEMYVPDRGRGGGPRFVHVYQELATKLLCLRLRHGGSVLRDLRGPLDDRVLAQQLVDDGGLLTPLDNVLKPFMMSAVGSAGTKRAHFHSMLAEVAQRASSVVVSSGVVNVLGVQGADGVITARGIQWADELNGAVGAIVGGSPAGVCSFDELQQLDPDDQQLQLVSGLVTCIFTPLDGAGPVLVGTHFSSSLDDASTVTSRAREWASTIRMCSHCYKSESECTVTVCEECHARRQLCGSCNQQGYQHWHVLARPCEACKASGVECRRATPVFTASDCDLQASEVIFDNAVDGTEGMPDVPHSVRNFVRHCYWNTVLLGSSMVAFRLQMIIELLLNSETYSPLLRPHIGRRAARLQDRHSTVEMVSFLREGVLRVLSAIPGFVSAPLLLPAVQTTEPEDDTEVDECTSILSTTRFSGVLSFFRSGALKHRSLRHNAKVEAVLDCQSNLTGRWDDIVVDGDSACMVGDFILSTELGGRGHLLVADLSRCFSSALGKSKKNKKLFFFAVRLVDPSNVVPAEWGDSLGVRRIAAAGEPGEAGMTVNAWVAVQTASNHHALLRIEVNCAVCQGVVVAAIGLLGPTHDLISAPSPGREVYIMLPGPSGQLCRKVAWDEDSPSVLRQVESFPIVCDEPVHQLLQVRNGVWFGRVGCRLCEFEPTADGLRILRRTEPYPPEATEAPVRGGPLAELQFRDPRIARFGASVVAIDNAQPAPLHVLSRIKDVVPMLRHIQSIAKSFGLLHMGSAGDNAVFLDLGNRDAWNTERQRLSAAKRFIEETEASQIQRTGFRSGQGQACALSLVNRRALVRSVDAFITAVESLMLVKDVIRGRAVKRRRVTTLWNEKLHAMLQVQRGDATAPSLLQCLRKLGPALQQLYMRCFFGGPAAVQPLVAEQYYHEPERGNEAPSEHTLDKLLEVRKTLVEERLPGAPPGGAAHAECKRVAEVQRQRRTRAQTTGPTGAYTLNRLMRPRRTTLHTRAASVYKAPHTSTGMSLVRPPRADVVAAIIPPDDGADFWLVRVRAVNGADVRIAYFEEGAQRPDRARSRSRRGRGNHQDKVDFTPWDGEDCTIGIGAIVDRDVDYAGDVDESISITRRMAEELTAKVNQIRAPHRLPPVEAEDESQPASVGQDEDGERECPLDYLMAALVEEGGERDEIEIDDWRELD